MRGSAVSASVQSASVKTLSDGAAGAAGDEIESLRLADLSKLWNRYKKKSPNTGTVDT